MAAKRAGKPTTHGIAALGVKHDKHKARTDLLPPRALLEVAQVLGHGAKKYSPDNWRHVMAEPGGRDRYVAAALRHIFDAQAGEFTDPESGYSHWAHAACCLLFLAEEDKP